MRMSDPPIPADTASAPREVVPGIAASPALIDALANIRDHFLEAVPLAAAVVASRAGRIEIDAANELFRALDASDPSRTARGVIERGALGERIGLFLDGDEANGSFPWSDGGEVAGRQFEVRLSRVFPLVASEPRGIVTFIDRTAERQTEKNLRLEMFNDALTGLPNRAGFNESIERLLAAGGPIPSHAVLIVDLRRFSRINESIGPTAGDEMLITVARRLMSALRAGDVIARTGGNEFGLLVRLGDEGMEDAQRVARRVAAIFQHPCRLSDLEIKVDCAIGGALFDADCDVAEIVRRAQFAVKSAKLSGDFEVYQPSASTIARKRFTMETDLRRAIEGDALTLAFQPLIDLASGGIAGFEALARWRHDGIDIHPSEFIPVAEESGLIVGLGRWALDRAMRTLKEWDGLAGAPLPIRMAVNISPIQIVRDDVAAMVGQTLKTIGIGGDRLMLELTESAIVADPDRAALMLDSLKGHDATIAMDDFGTGFSNLASLQRLPIDMLKIDRSFVTGMLEDRDKAAIVRAVLSLARALGMETTAEGIETFALAQLLGALGCTRGQGYFYSRALAADEAFDYWRSLSA